MKESTSDQIRRQIVLHAPRSRVWRALSNAQEFGDWFGVRLSGTFRPGERIKGNITHPGYEHIVWDVIIDRIEPESLISWRWHPFAVEPGRDYSDEPMTLVVFTLEDVPEGTLLTVVESGFDEVPAGRRLDAFRANGEGWTEQMNRVRRHVAGEA